MTGGELNIENRKALTRYLIEAGHIDAPAALLDWRVLPGGVSSRTVLVQLTGDRQWVLKQALAKLRVEVDWFSDPMRIHREAEGLRWLATLAPPGAVPPFLFEDHDHHVLAMQAVPQPHENWKAMLLAGRVHLEQVQQFASLLAAIHRGATGQARTLQKAFEDRSYFESLRIEPYYKYSASTVPDAAGFLGDLIERTRDRRLALVHGDFSPKNILVHDGRLVLLDHEVIHWGDPAFDAGFALAHLLSKAHHVKEHRDAFAQAAREFFWHYLAQLEGVRWARVVEAMVVRHTLGCLLARVAGRSKLEYLSAAQRKAQGLAVVDLMARPPVRVVDLVRGFLARVAL